MRQPSWRYVSMSREGYRRGRTWLFLQVFVYTWQVTGFTPVATVHGEAPAQAAPGALPVSIAQGGQQRLVLDTHTTLPHSPTIKFILLRDWFPPRAASQMLIASSGTLYLLE